MLLPDGNQEKHDQTERPAVRMQSCTPSTHRLHQHLEKDEHQ